MSPLTENLLHGKATKPGDVVTAMNGKTIEVDNTDAEGRLLLADALYYVTKKYEPRSVLDLATLTGAMDVALGYPFTGVFTHSTSLWEQLQAAGLLAGDRFWRMPLCSDYKTQISSQVADLKNVGGRSGGACTAAIFLNEFLYQKDKNTKVAFAHLDIAGVFHKKSSSIDTLCSGMTGRPTRAVIEYLCQQSKKI